MIWLAFLLFGWLCAAAAYVLALGTHRVYRGVDEAEVPWWEYLITAPIVFPLGLFVLVKERVVGRR